MKIILLNPPFFDVYKGYEKAAKIGASYPPTGLMYIASKLISDGHEVELFDIGVENLTNEETLELVKNVKPDLIGITATTPIFHRACELAELIKRTMNVPIVLGGIHVTIVGADVFRDHKHFDFAVVGEGEETISELAACLENNQDPSGVNGIYYLKDGVAVATAPRDPINDLDKLPFPFRESKHKKLYTWLAPGKGDIPIAILSTKRGCPFKCTFCSQHSMFGRQVRYRSVENVLDELEEIVNVHKITHIFNIDDTLVIKRKRMMALCEGIKSRNLKFTWEGMARANLVDKELLETMAAAGLSRMSFGIESGDEEVLRIIEKGVTLEQIRQAYKWAKEAGIETRGSAIIGHPGETRKSVWKTINFLRSLKHLDQVYINIMVPYPGTVVYDLAKRGKSGYRLLSTNFNEYIRYNQSVLEINDLDRKSLQRFQKIGLILFYATPSRIWYTLRRAGFINGVVAILAGLKGLASKSSK